MLSLGSNARQALTGEEEDERRPGRKATTSRGAEDAGSVLLGDRELAGRQASSPMRRRQRRPRVASDSARRRKNAGMGRELGSGAAAANAGPA